MFTISQLNVYPIKSCAGIALDAARLLPYGLEFDRNWMVVDGNGRFLTQREFPKLARVAPEFDADAGELVVRAPGQAPLRMPLEAAALAGAPHVTVTVWRDTVAALDTGDVAARWFSEWLGASVRLVRFDPAASRVASRTWTRGTKTQVRFADGFPVLVIGEASLADLNARLAQKGVDAMPMNRFRPNVVLTGLSAYEEDFVETLRIDAGERPVELRLVKPCPRCPIPTIDQARGEPDPRWPHEPTDTMSAYRADSRVDGALTFGQNAIVVEGAGTVLAVGQTVEVELRFAD